MSSANGEMSSGYLRQALAELEQATYHHEQWLEGLNATLACRLPPDARDMDDDAHCKCRFGQWYYGSGSAKLAAHPGFAAVEHEHRAMHERAGKLLRMMVRGDAFALRDYQAFAHAAQRLRLEVSTLKSEIETTLFSLDPLTGAANRVGMLTRLREQQELVRRKVLSCGLVMMDLDHFKLVNDTYGHAVGDRVLATFARFMLDRVRPYDRLFRYGGEEFLLCAPNTNLDEACELAERLRKGLAALRFDADGALSFNVTVSCGICVLDPVEPIEQSIDRADKALYNAKVAGRDRIAVWNGDARSIMLDAAGD